MYLKIAKNNKGEVEWEEFFADDEMKLLDEGNSLEIGLANRYVKVIPKPNESPRPKKNTGFRFW